jgi:TPR repeat protein
MRAQAIGAAALASAIALLGSACRSAPLVLSPEPPGPSAWPAGGAPSRALARGGAGAGFCASAGEAPCGGSAAAECTERALSAWSEAQDDRAVACVARMLSEACSLGDPRGCAFAGRLWLDGRGVARDAERGMDMLVRACDGGVGLACLVGARWLGDSANVRDIGAPELRARLELEHACIVGQSDSCYQVGLLFYFGKDAFPRDRAKANEAYARGCDLGDARACNNLGDGLAYGDGAPRDTQRAAATFAKACRLGEALGCANWGYMAERGEGMERDLARARALYRDACATGDIYGCLHADMLAAEDAGAPRDPDRALAHWRRACERDRNARACSFVGLMYEDGPDGFARDETKSLQAMNRACELGDRRACEWVKSRPSD